MLRIPLMLLLLFQWRLSQCGQGGYDGFWGANIGHMHRPIAELAPEPNLVYLTPCNVFGSILITCVTLPVA